MSQTREDIGHRLDADGFAVIESVFDSAEVEHLKEQVAAARKNRFARTRHGNAFAIRNLLAVSPEVSKLAHDPPLAGIARDLLGPDAKAVWGIVYDRIPAANWKIPWHQDLAITVDGPVRVPGFDVWTEKLGIPHVEAPIPILQQMVALRVHLDDCDEDSGAFEVIAGSHRHGRLDPERVEELRRSGTRHVCAARAGDVLALSRLLLHCSAPAKEPSHQRILHLEYAACDLPGELRWYEEGVEAAPVE